MAEFYFADANIGGIAAEGWAAVMYNEDEHTTYSLSVPVFTTTDQTALIAGLLDSGPFWPTSWGYGPITEITEIYGSIGSGWFTVSPAETCEVFLNFDVRPLKTDLDMTIEGLRDARTSTQQHAPAAGRLPDAEAFLDQGYVAPDGTTVGSDNGTWDYADLNGNGVLDAGEPHEPFDDVNGNGIRDDGTVAVKIEISGRTTDGPREIIVKSTNGDVVRLRNPSNEGDVQVMTATEIRWYTHVRSVTLEAFPGPNPRSLTGGAIKAEVSSIDEPSHPDAFWAEVRVFPEDTTDMNGVPIPPVFVPVTGSSEQTTLAPGVDLVLFTRDGTPLSEEKEASKCSIIQVNNDDDDGDSPGAYHGEVNVVHDKDDANGVEGEDDLLTLKIRQYIRSSPCDPPVTLKLQFPDSHIRIWRNANKTSRMTSGSTFPHDRDTTLYIEGIKPHANRIGDTITLTAESNGSTIAQDTVRVVVAQSIFALVGDGPGSYAPNLIATLGGRKIDSGTNPFLVEGKLDDAEDSADRTPCYYAVWIWRTQKLAKMALAAESGYVVFEEHSNFGMGWAFFAQNNQVQRNPIWITHFMNVGHEYANIGYRYMVETTFLSVGEGYPGLTGYPDFWVRNRDVPQFVDESVYFVHGVVTLRCSPTAAAPTPRSRPPPP